MKVFYVVVLVLVAGAVLSHGRTVSEGTVFNKTQLLESMSNVTVSSSELVSYGFSYLAMQWPRSVCMVNQQCIQPLPTGFTVHGLWPQINRTHRVDCEPISQHYNPFNIDLLERIEGLVHGLNCYWPDLIFGDNQEFWGYEYEKHGSCTYDDQIRYFKDTLALARNFKHLFSKLTERGGITLDRPYSSDEIKGAVYRVTNKWPRLQCVRVRNRFLLMEIRFCVIRNQLTNCSHYTDCGNRNVYLPPPSAFSS